MSMMVGLAIGGIIAAVFMVLWIRERRHAAQAEIVAYGLRTQDDSDENTKTSISELENGYEQAIDRLEQLGEIRRNNWGEWIWTQTGKPLGEV